MIKVKINDREYLICKTDHNYSINQDQMNIDLYKRNNHQFHILHNGLSLNAEVVKADLQNKEIEIVIKGRTFHTKIISEKDSILEIIGAATSNDTLHQKILSPMPGLIQKVLVSEGDKVSTGDPLLVLNAMKMENVLKSPSEGKISQILIKEGEQVEKGKVLIQF